MKRITFYVICSATALLCVMSCSKMDKGGDVPENPLPGVFSVSATKQVHFSKGNLVATIDASGAPIAWKFAANQYDCLGEGGANKTIGTKAGDVDLFGWSTGATKYGISTSISSSDYSGNFVDWGKAIGDGVTWRTLSRQEWQYLFNLGNQYGVTCRSGKYKYEVSVCGKIDCVVIAPDDWNLTANPLQKSYGPTSTPMTWEQAEAAGLVCLPAAGQRFSSSVYNAGYVGHYWSSTAYDEIRAYVLYFDGRPIFPDYGVTRDSGSSVRLITDVK